MDSSICLKLAMEKWGKDNILAITFDYTQRHSSEIAVSKKICNHWKVEQMIIPINFLKKITFNSLTHHDLNITNEGDTAPNSLVLGRNGLITRIASIHAESIGASEVYTGVIEVEESNSGYRDCNRKYFDLLQELLRIDFGHNEFRILTPLVKMTKVQTMELAEKLGELEYLLENTITCYKGIPKQGCGSCPSCLLRNNAILEYAQNKNLEISYLNKLHDTE